MLCCPVLLLRASWAAFFSLRSINDDGCEPARASYLSWCVVCALRRDATRRRTNWWVRGFGRLLEHRASRPVCIIKITATRCSGRRLNPFYPTRTPSPRDVLLLRYVIKARALHRQVLALDALRVDADEAHDAAGRAVPRHRALDRLRDERLALGERHARLELVVDVAVDVRTAGPADGEGRLEARAPRG